MALLPAPVQVQVPVSVPPLWPRALLGPVLVDVGAVLAVIGVVIMGEARIVVERVSVWSGVVEMIKRR